MARSTTARRLAVVVTATAFVSMAGVGGASAATPNPQPAPATTGIATGGLLGGLTETLNITLNGLLNGIPASSPEAKAPALGKTVDKLTKTVKELPLLGPPVGGLTDGLGLSEAEDTAKPAPAAPQTATSNTKPGKDKGRTDRNTQVSPAGSTWTAPMTVNLPTAPAVEAPKGGGILNGIVRDVTSLLPSNASEAAAAGAGAATIALIVLGGIAVTGAAGAASVAGRRGLVSGSMGGSL